MFVVLCCCCCRREYAQQQHHTELSTTTSTEQATTILQKEVIYIYDTTTIVIDNTDKLPGEAPDTVYVERSRGTSRESSTTSERLTDTYQDQSKDSVITQTVVVNELNKQQRYIYTWGIVSIVLILVIIVAKIAKLGKLF